MFWSLQCSFAQVDSSCRLFLIFTMCSFFVPFFSATWTTGMTFLISSFRTKKRFKTFHVDLKTGGVLLRLSFFLFISRAALTRRRSRFITATARFLLGEFMQILSGLLASNILWCFYIISSLAQFCSSDYRIRYERVRFVSVRGQCWTGLSVLYYNNNNNRQTVHTNTDLNGILHSYSASSGLSFNTVLLKLKLCSRSRWCQLCGQRVCQTVHVFNRTSSTLMNVQPRDGRVKLCRTCLELQEHWYVSTPVHAWRGAIISHTHTHSRFGSACLQHLFFNSFISVHSQFDQDISWTASDKEGKNILKAEVRGRDGTAASPPPNQNQILLRPQTMSLRSEKPESEFDADEESPRPPPPCPPVKMKEAVWCSVCSITSDASPESDCEGRDRRLGNRRSPKYCLFSFL